MRYSEVVQQWQNYSWKGLLPLINKEKGIIKTEFFLKKIETFAS